MEQAVLVITILQTLAILNIILTEDYKKFSFIKVFQYCKILSYKQMLLFAEFSLGLNTVSDYFHLHSGTLTLYLTLPNIHRL